MRRSCIAAEDGTVDDTADELLDRFETAAARVVVRIADPGYAAGARDAFDLVNFIVTLKNRTPQAREALRDADEKIAEMDLEMRLSDRETFHRLMGRGRPEYDVEAERRQMLADLQAGRIGLESNPAREVAMMFMGFEHTAATVFEQLGIVCMRIPPDEPRRFILSDHPVSHYDASPKSPEAGASFMSSPNSVTWVPLDPTFGVLFVQGTPQTWGEAEVRDAEVDELNLLTYAWAREAIYGPSQEAVTRVRRHAKDRPHVLREFRYRPPRIWVTDATDADTDTDTDVHEFQSRFKRTKATRSFRISPTAMEDARRRAWSEAPASVDDPAER